jgi:hypothetical protein
MPAKLHTAVTSLAERLGLIQSKLRTPETPLDELRAARAATAGVLTSAEAEIDRLQADRPRLLVEAGDDETLAAHDAKIATERRNKERAEATLPRLDQRIAAAEAEQAEARRRALFDAVKPAIETYNNKVAPLVPVLFDTLEQILAACEEAENIYDAAARDLPDGKQRADLPSRRLLAAVEDRIKPIRKTLLFDDAAAFCAYYDEGWDERALERRREVAEMLRPRPVIPDFGKPRPPIVQPTVTGGFAAMTPNERDAWFAARQPTEKGGAPNLTSRDVVDYDKQISG